MSEDTSSEISCPIFIAYKKRLSSNKKLHTYKKKREERFKNRKTKIYLPNLTTYTHRKKYRLKKNAKCNKKKKEYLVKHK